MSLGFPLRNFTLSSHHLIAFPSFQIQRTLHCSSFNIIASTCNQFHAISFQVAQCFPVDMRADSRACSSAHVPVEMPIPEPIFESVSCYLPRQFKCLVHLQLATTTSSSNHDFVPPPSSVLLPAFSLLGDPN